MVLTRYSGSNHLFIVPFRPNVLNCSRGIRRSACDAIVSVFIRLYNKKFQVRVTHELLPKPRYFTCDTQQEAELQKKEIEKSLARGVVPASLARLTGAALFSNIEGSIRAYERAASVPRSSSNLLSAVISDIGDTALKELNNAWADQWVYAQKLKKHRAPGTLRHHVGALSRCLSWVVRTHPDYLIANPLKELPRGYSKYNSKEAAEMKALGLEVPEDLESVNRLMKDEEVAVREIFTARIKKAENAERGGKPEDTYYGVSAVHWHSGALLIFLLALESCMRMREMYTLSWEQIDLKERTVFLDKTKNGDSREVPLSTAAGKLLESESKRVHPASGMLVFPFWNGDSEEAVLENATSAVSHYFGRVFEQAGCGHFNFHDTRSEAICRLVLYIPPSGVRLSDTQVARITGHRDPRMLRRYMRLRGSELANMLP